MTHVPASSHGGGGPVAGTYLPAADSTGVTLDTTTYDNPVEGADKLATLVFPLSTAALALAIAGDAFPRYVFVSNPLDGLYLGDGTTDPYNGAQVVAYSVAASGANRYANVEGGAATLQVGGADARGGGQVNLIGSPARIRWSTAAGGITGGAGAPAIGGEVGDHYIRSDGPPYLYECTVAGGAGAATWVTLPQAAPADASLRAGDCVVWFDKTNGAAKLMAKGKTTDGTVVTASIAMA